MNSQSTLDYDRIAKAIGYIRENFREQPNLDEVAEQIHLSSFHFQRMFKEWAGVSPKKFLQYISVEHAKQILQDKNTTLFDVAYDTGLSGTGRLHDLFIKIEGMTPGEYKNGGEKLTINYSFAESPFGNILVASTAKGICHIAFSANEEEAFLALTQNFPKAQFRQMTDLIQQNALHVFTHNWDEIDQVKLHLKGTEFQLKVWEALLQVPMGQLSTYGNIAMNIGNEKGSRAVGTAIGSNPVAFLIPCHRVIRSTGVIDGYRWGNNRKAAIIGWEAAKTDSEA
ncbi:methylated-DNA--[protein]-cysteine S-methyltransferase [Sinomicrobium sp. M5D2P17]